MVRRFSKSLIPRNSLLSYKMIKKYSPICRTPGLQTKRLIRLSEQLLHKLGQRFRIQRNRQIRVPLAKYTFFKFEIPVIYYILYYEFRMFLQTSVLFVQSFNPGALNPPLIWLKHARQHDSMYPVEPKSQSEGVSPVLIILCDTIRRISFKMNTNGKIES